MIFNKDKKSLSKEISGSNSLEDNAIDRWRTINTSEEEEDEVEFVQDQEQDPSYKERSSFLNSLMKDGPAKARRELFPNENEVDVPNEEHTRTTLKIDRSSLSIEEIKVDQFEVEEIEEAPEVQIVQLKESDNDLLNASAKIPLEQIIQVEKTPEKIEPRTPTADFTKDIEEDLKNRFGTNLKSALGEGTVIEGTFSFETPVKVNGNLTGEIKSSSALIVGENAQVNAKIKVGTLIVLGSVEGEIEVGDLVEIRSTGSVFGEITTKRIALEEGGVFNGACTITP